jgi:hypothetical protein
MMKRLRMIGILLLMLILSSAFGVFRATESSGKVGVILPPKAVVEAREALIAALDIDVEEIEIVSQKQKTWLDSCLGLGRIDESCMRSDLSGWLVELSAKDETFKARTD